MKIFHGLLKRENSASPVRTFQENSRHFFSPPPFFFPFRTKSQQQQREETIDLLAQIANLQERNKILEAQIAALHAENADIMQGELGRRYRELQTELIIAQTHRQVFEKQAAEAQEARRKVEIDAAVAEQKYRMEIENLQKQIVHMAGQAAPIGGFVVGNSEQSTVAKRARTEMNATCTSSSSSLPSALTPTVRAKQKDADHFFSIFSLRVLYFSLFSFFKKRMDGNKPSFDAIAFRM